MNKVTIWKDNILLEWDKKLPPLAPLTTREENVNKYWEYLQDIARWIPKMHKFVMPLSYNNIQRIHRQFGDNLTIDPRDVPFVDTFLNRSSAFFKMCVRAEEIKKTPFNELPKYDYKVPPLGEYQHRGVVLLTEIPRFPLFADCGCLSGDTKIIYKMNGGKGKRYQLYEDTLSDMYRVYKRYIERTWANVLGANVENVPFRISIIAFKGVKKETRMKRDSNGKPIPELEDYNDYNLGFHPVERIVEQGVKEVWRLTLKDGKSVKATADHEILTDKGWKRLDSLVVGDSVIIDHSSYRRESPSSSVDSIEFVGPEMTYDIVCTNPHRNFIGNGIVLHNCGKTYMALNSIQNHVRNNVIPKRKTLIVAKLATLETGWLEDAEKFTDLKIVNLWLPQSKKRREKFLELLNEDADSYLINHDGVRVFEKELKEMEFQKVIVDESTILKGFHGTYKGIKGGQFGRSLLEVSSKAHWRVIMSGTPAPNGPEDLWGQFFFIDPAGNLLERSFSNFQCIYMNKIQLGSKITKYVPKPDALRRVGEEIKDLTYRLRIRDNIDLPPLTKIVRSIKMSAEQEKHYSEMEEALETEINSELVTVTIALSKITKLRQITSGFLIDLDEKPHPLEINPKLNELDSILDDEIGATEKVVIYAQYKWEIDTIKKRYKKYGIVSVYGENTTKENLRAIKSFREDANVRIIVLHPKSAAHGITFTMACYMIFFSISYSAEDNYQCVKRIERAGQSHPMVVFYLLCKDSIEEIIYQVLMRKEMGQQQLIDKEIIDQWRKHKNGLKGKNLPV